MLEQEFRSLSEEELRIGTLLRKRIICFQGLTNYRRGFTTGDRPLGQRSKEIGDLIYQPVSQPAEFFRKDFYRRLALFQGFVSWDAFHFVRFPSTQSSLLRVPAVFGTNDSYCNPSNKSFSRLRPPLTRLKTR